MEQNKTELNVEEMSQAVGGAGGKGWHTYTVVEGDTLIGIAKRFGISSYKEIVMWNASLINNPNLIRPGWKLRLYY